MEVYRRRLNQENMQQILDSFVELTGIRAAYFDSNNETITGKNKPLCEFCQMLRKFKNLYSYCISSDKAAFKAAEETKATYIYKCHMGLYEAVIPIYAKNNLMGFLMLGQVMNMDESDTQLSCLNEKLRSLNLTSEQITAFTKACASVTCMSMAKIEAAANMLGIIVQHIINTDIIYIHDMDSIQKAKHYIGQHFNKPLSTGTIAEFSCLSPSYLSFLFKRETGLTITHYIDKCRLDHAKELLILTSMSVKEISWQVGYSDQNYFSRIFKKREGISPVEYRIKSKKSC